MLNQYPNEASNHNIQIATGVRAGPVRRHITMNLKMISTALVLALMIQPAMAQQEAAPSSEAKKPVKAKSRFPKDVAGLEAMAQQAIEEDNGLRLLQTTILLRRQEPYDPENLVNMVRAYAMMERPTSAYNYMLQMQQQGLSYDFDSLEETINLQGTEVYDYVNDLLIRAGNPAGEAEPVFDLNSKHALPRAIAWDASRERFLVGTAEKGELLAVDDSGKTKRLLSADADNGLWAIMGIAVDAENNRLWISSAAVPQFEGFSNEDVGKSGLFAFELDSLEPAGEYFPDPAQGPHAFGSIVVTPAGDVFVADRETAVLYRKSADAEVFAPFLADKELNGFTDMAVSPTGSRIYLADAAHGVLVIDPENEGAAMLGGPDTLNLGGISGLFHTGTDLIIVQSGINPQRLMSLQLDPSGGSVEDVRPMAIALEWFDGPSVGTIRGDSVYYYANALADGDDVTVLRTPLDAGDDIVAPDMLKFEEETLSRARDHQ